MEYRYLPKEEIKPQKYEITTEIPANETPEYYYNYSWQFDWVNLNENIISECWLESGHELKLTNRKLHIQHKNYHKVWDLPVVRSCSISFKRLMLPLVIGGITAPLSLVALMSGFLHLWTGIALLFIGILLMVYGYKGSYQLVIQLMNNHFSIFLDEKTRPLQKFINQTNIFLEKK